MDRTDTMIGQAGKEGILLVEDTTLSRTTLALNTTHHLNNTVVNLNTPLIMVETNMTVRT